MRSSLPSLRQRTRLKRPSASLELPEAAGSPVAADAVAVRPLKKWVPEHLRPREAAPAAEVLER